MSSKLLVIGSINMDLVMQTPRFPQPGENLIAGPLTQHPGGKGANQAVAAARLGGDVALAGAVGDDVFGASLLQTLRSEAIDTSHMMVKEGVATGTAVIPVDPSGENMIMVALGANMALTQTDIATLQKLIAAADVLILQLEIPDAALLEAAQIARANGSRVILNAAPYRELPSGLLALTDTLIVNRYEALSLAGKSANTSMDTLMSSLIESEPNEVVLTLGAEGALHHDGETMYEQPAFAIQAVDATGAGDAFVGAFAVSQAEGKSRSEAMRFAAAAGALAAGVAGAIPSLPTRAAVVALVNTAGK